MNVSIIQTRLESYNCKNRLEEENAIREIAQEIVLSGLSRAGFFRNAAFLGGTCLRIIYGLPRFSEDLDFALFKAEEEFKLTNYLDAVCKELLLYGFEFSLSGHFEEKTAVQKEFLKDSSIVKMLTFKYFRPGRDTRSIKIKLEIDTNPPAGAKVEVKSIDYPFTYEAAVYDQESLFAGKCHALLCREYVKGRDWFDFTWYIGRKTGINFNLLTSAMDQQGPWKGKGIKIDKNWCVENLRKRVAEIDWKKTADDVKRFLKPDEAATVELWSVDFFNSRIEKLEQYIK